MKIGPVSEKAYLKEWEIDLAPSGRQGANTAASSSGNYAWAKFFGRLTHQKEMAPGSWPRCPRLTER
ncbi:MAG: hypothetical protein QXS27_08855 [Candidatus Jordarchaeaceae archaeon]